jgi:hypothetical protein
MNMIGKMVSTAVVVGCCSVAGLAQVPKPLEPDLARVRALIEADPQAANARNPSGLTPMHLAALYNQRAVAEYLITKGADVNAVARHSGTPVDGAYESENQAMVEWLQTKGARFTPIRFDVTELTPVIHRIAFTWGMMNNVLDVFPANATLVSGHGRDLTAAGVRACRDALNAMIGIVRVNLAAGRTADQMVQDEVLKAYKGQYSLLEFLMPDTLIPRVVAAVQQGTLK